MDWIRNIIITLFSIAVILIILIILFIIWIEGVAAEDKEKEKAEKAEKEKREQISEAKAKQVYAENLPRLYDHRSTSELKQIYGLLQTIHRNRMDFNDPSTFGPASDIAYSTAYDELMRAMENPRWKQLVEGGKIEYTRIPIYVTMDMHYVYEILGSRGITNW